MLNLKLISLPSVFNQKLGHLAGIIATVAHGQTHVKSTRNLVYPLLQTPRVDFKNMKGLRGWWARWQATRTVWVKLTAETDFISIHSVRLHYKGWQFWLRSAVVNGSSVDRLEVYYNLSQMEAQGPQIKKTIPLPATDSTDPRDLNLLDAIDSVVLWGALHTPNLHHKISSALDQDWTVIRGMHINLAFFSGH